MLKIIPRPVHAALDYVYGVTALMAPKVLGFDDDSKATLTVKSMGAGAITSALTTDFEGGIVKVVPFNTHLKMDVSSALMSAITPWRMGFAGNIKARNTVLALVALELLVVAMSQRDPS